MSLYLEGAVGASPFPGMEVINVGSGLSPQEFLELGQSFVRPAHVDFEGAPVQSRPSQPDGKVIKATRTLDSPRDPWAPDHHWHSDKTYWGDNPFASALYAQRLAGEVAGTGFIDTTLLLEEVEDDNPGIGEELFAAGAVFSVRRYYEDILRNRGSAEAIAKTLERFEASSLEEVLDKECSRYPEKTFPAILPHPFRESPSLMTDTVRLMRYEGIDESRSAEIMHIVASEYLDLPLEELLERPYHYLHTWEEGQLVIYPQIGTLHRAMPSPDNELRRDTLRQFIA